ncbi:MAG: adenylate/guanylate cyclase domain-containing protein [Betaproteobacteria bacterium]
MTERILDRSLSSVVREVQKRLRSLKPTSSTEAVAFFDLSGSTALKLRRGHQAGVEAALRFGLGATEIVGRCEGIVVKELGDGVLARFPDPLNACRAALNLKALSVQLGLTGSYGLTLGRISRYAKGRKAEDIYGTVVDRCARIQGIASSQQVLIDQTLYESVKTHLGDYPELILSDPFTAEAKGLGTLRLWEISTKELGLIGRLGAPLRVYAHGRPSIEEKVQFMSSAKFEVVEVGIGLTTFAKYFTGQKPREFRDHIARLLQRGISVKCLAADPGYKGAIFGFAERKEGHYKTDLLRARQQILSERRALLTKGYPGRLEYHAYRAIPEFSCICVDAADAENGRMLFAPYVAALPRAECPTYQIGRASEPELFDKYWKAIERLQQRSREVK